MNHIEDDPGIHLTPTGARIVLGVLLIALVVALLISFTRAVGAAPATGNAGGCSESSKRYALACTVQDAGVGWVSGSCLYGEYFLAQTRRTFRVGDAVTVRGCVDEHGTLFSAPGFPLRISKNH